MKLFDFLVEVIPKLLFFVEKVTTYFDNRRKRKMEEDIDKAYSKHPADMFNDHF